eukprot:jgi/Galph1/3635/GphlegSOOS_G2305.1
MKTLRKEEIYCESRCELNEAIREGSFEGVVYTLDWLEDSVCGRIQCPKTNKKQRNWLHGYLKCQCFKHESLKKALTRVLLDNSLLGRKYSKDPLPLLLSCSHPNSDIVLLLVTLVEQLIGLEKTELLRDTESGWNILHRCCYFGHLSHIKVLMSCSIDMNLEVVKRIALLRFQTLCSLADKEGYLPLDLLMKNVDDNKASTLSAHMIVAFGSNEDFELGTGKDCFEASPKPLELEKIQRMMGDSIIAVSTASRHSLFLSRQGVVLAVGVGTNGRLGLGDEETRTQPQMVRFTSKTFLSSKGQNTLKESQKNRNKGALRFTQVHTADDRSGALEQSGVLYLWGNGISVPERVGGPLRNIRIVDFSLCSTHTGVITEAGLVYCWGKNDAEQLGIESSVLPYSNVPHLISCLKNIQCRHIFVERRISAVIDSRGKVFLWGNGSASPVRISLEEKPCYSNNTSNRKRSLRKQTAKKIAFVKEREAIWILSGQGELFEVSCMDRNNMENRTSLVANPILWKNRFLLSDVAVGEKDCFGIDFFSRVIYWSLDNIPKMIIRSDLRGVTFLSVSGRHGFAGVAVPCKQNMEDDSKCSQPLSLKSLCEDTLESTLSLSTALPLLSFAVKVASDQLKSSCLCFITQCLDSILCYFPQSFVEMDYETLSLLEEYWKKSFKKSIHGLNMAPPLCIGEIPKGMDDFALPLVQNTNIEAAEYLDAIGVYSKNSFSTCSKFRQEINQLSTFRSSVLQEQDWNVTNELSSHSSVENDKNASAIFKKRETKKHLYLSSVMQQEHEVQQASLSLVSKTKLTLQDVIRKEKKESSWDKSKAQFHLPSISFATIQKEQYEESEDKWHSSNTREEVFHITDTSCPQTTKQMLTQSTPSITIPTHLGHSPWKEKSYSASPAWKEDSHMSQVSFRQIIEEEERKKIYFSKSLSPISFSPTSSRTWTKLPNESPVMRKPLKKIETEELALKKLREQYPTACVRRAPEYHTC